MRCECCGRGYGRYKMRYKNRQIWVKDIRKHYCSQCGKEGITVLHHTKYDDNDPLAFTVELCKSCHSKENKKLMYMTKQEKWAEFLITNKWPVWRKITKHPKFNTSHN